MNTVATFKATVDANGGPQRLISLIFNNAYTKTFEEGEVFDYATQLNETDQYIIFNERDTRGIPYKVIKPIEYLEGMIFANSVEDAQKIDRRYIRG